VEAAGNGDVSLLKQAMMMDPLVGAACNTQEISQMTDEMLVAQAQWLPQYADEIPAASRPLRKDLKVRNHWVPEAPQGQPDSRSNPSRRRAGNGRRHRLTRRPYRLPLSGVLIALPGLPRLMILIPTILTGRTSRSKVSIKGIMSS